MADRRPTARQREVIRTQAAGCCEYCRSQERFATQAFSVEHIIPRAADGTSIIDNLALACQGCNNHKYTRTNAIDPATGDLSPLFHPRRQRWTDHFAWNDSYTRIIGITPTGRATIEALNLKRSGLVNLRSVLYELGQHPPTAVRAVDGNQ
jgi:hypothetical protein